MAERSWACNACEQQDPRDHADGGDIAEGPRVLGGDANFNARQVSRINNGIAPHYQNTGVMSRANLDQHTASLGEIKVRHYSAMLSAFSAFQLLFLLQASNTCKGLHEGEYKEAHGPRRNKELSPGAALPRYYS
jgi:hypothetical protein